MCKKLFLLVIFGVCFSCSLPAAEEDSSNGNYQVSEEEQSATLSQLDFWLKTMRHFYGYSWKEISLVTGMEREQVKKAVQELQIDITPYENIDGKIIVLPYPGGRHSRIGFLDGAINPQRGTKAGIFLPWKGAGYVVVDLPEAIFSNLGLTYLAHTHIPTIWDEKDVTLKNIDWTRSEDGILSYERELPNKIAFGASIRAEDQHVAMELWLRNGTDHELTDLRTQICVMVKGAPAFDGLTNDNKILREPVAAVRSDEGNRWILTAWEHCGRCWANEDVPCMHSDPVLPDCLPGETVKTRGKIWFFEGEDIDKEIEGFHWK